MPEGKEYYENIRIEAVENGFKVGWVEKSMNPMEHGDFNPDRYKYEHKELVFQAQGESISAKKKALKEAVAKLEDLYVMNLGKDKED